MAATRGSTATTRNPIDTAPIKMVARIPTIRFVLATCLVLQAFAQLQPTVDAMSTGQSGIRNKNSGPRMVITPQWPQIQINAKLPYQIPSCRAEGAEPHLFTSIRWSGPNNDRNWDQLKARHSIEDADLNTINLRFVNPTHEDSGTYYCTGDYQSNDHLNASIDVLVFYPLEFKNCPGKQFLTQGDSNGKISCLIDGDSLKAVVKKDGKVIMGPRYVWDNVNDVLVINGIVDPSDAGNYTITARSEVTGQELQQKIVVDVNSKPEIIVSNDSYAVEGEQAHLECKVTGNPRPLVYWQDSKKRNLTSEGGYTVTPEKGTLLIHRVNKERDQGQFKCDAINNVGSDSRIVTMSVDTRPNIVSFDNKTVEEGSEVTFECRSTGEPAPKFSIRKQGINQLPYMDGDGQFKRLDVSTEEGGSNVYIHRLTIVAQRSHFGLHYCNATNRAGTAERYNHLFVKYKPDLSGTPELQFVRMGKDVVVNCNIRAFPPPRVTWWSDRTQIINVDSTFETSSDNQVHNIRMTPPSQQQVAFTTFTCRAENDMGITIKEIKAQYTTRPGMVSAHLAKRTPTTAELSLYVQNDGGDRIRRFIYRLEGRTLDIHNPTYNYRLDIKSDTEIAASSRSTDTYIIKNLLPFYSYKIRIRAVNDVGEGDETEVHLETLKATRPEPPIIIRPDSALAQHSTPGYFSEYTNGYDLRWSPPELDNGDSITKYSIKYYVYDPANPDSTSDNGHETIVEQMNERPMKASLGPLEPGRRYKIELRAINKFGSSDPTYIMIFTKPEGQSMPRFESRSLPWLSEPSYPTIIALLSFAIVFAIIIDLFFCIAYQLGVCYTIRYWCCPPKATSVIDDKLTSNQLAHEDS